MRYTTEAARFDGTTGSSIRPGSPRRPTDYWVGAVFSVSGRMVMDSSPNTFRTRREALAWADEYRHKLVIVDEQSAIGRRIERESRA